MTDNGKQEIPLSIAAQRLGVSWPKAWRLVLQGTIAGRKANGRWQVSTEDVERLLQEDEQSMKAPRREAVPA